LLGVLQRIALAYTGGALLFCLLKPRALVAAASCCFGGYWAVMTFVPIRHVQLETKALAQQLGTPKPTPEQARLVYHGHDRARDRPVERGLNVANHFDFEHLRAANTTSTGIPRAFSARRRPS